MLENNISIYAEPISNTGKLLGVVLRFSLLVVVILIVKGAFDYGHVFAGLLIGYFISAYAEWATHVFFLHPSKRTLKFLNRFNNPGLTLPFRSHAGHHHGIFTEKRYSVEGNEEWTSALKVKDSNSLIIPIRDRVAIRNGDDPKLLHERNYGMSLNPHEFYWSNVRILIVTSLICWIFGLSSLGFLAAFLVAPAATVLNKYFHLYTHTPTWLIKRDGGFVIKLLIHTPYWRLVSRRHYQHHLEPNECNFCLFLPGPDWIMGTGRDPSDKDLKEMGRLGFVY